MDETTDGAADATGPVFRLIYRSQRLIPSYQRRTGLGEIFTTARRTNRGLHVTGALMVSGDSFVQALEGEEPVVRELYRTISQDGRHHHVTVLSEETVAGRTFGRWAMAQVGSDGGADIRLLSNATKGVIIAASGTDRSITPEQEAVLATMRESLALHPA